jgi:hypothetical protein
VPHNKPAEERKNEGVFVSGELSDTGLRNIVLRPQKSQDRAFWYENTRSVPRTEKIGHKREDLTESVSPTPKVSHVH